ncbi:hypothetical protein FACS18949_05630 [Clostridia bacterium]|nr:hypothetical protein FACS18949_05630 [Clostridia bacterium]
MKLRAQKFTGIEFCADGVHMVQTDANGRAVRSGSAEFSDGASDSGLLDAVRRAASVGGIKGGDCAVCIGGAGVVLRRFVLPRMDGGALLMNVRHEIRPYLALPPERYYIDCKVQSSSENDGALTLKVMAAAVPRDGVDKLVKTLKSAGFKPRFVDVAENSLEKLLNFQTTEENGAAVIRLGAERAAVTIILGRRFYVSRHISADALVSELSSVIDYGSFRERGRTIGRVYICGGAMDGLSEHIENALGLPVSRLDDCAGALGAALREEPRDINLMPSRRWFHTTLAGRRIVTMVP